jgi:hypothetical protein
MINGTCVGTRKCCTGKEIFPGKIRDVGLNTIKYLNTGIIHKHAGQKNV